MAPAGIRMEPVLVDDLLPNVRKAQTMFPRKIKVSSSMAHAANVAMTYALPSVCGSKQ